MDINEATFEARIDSEIRRLFPLLSPLDITHQKVFTLKLGHHDIELDGRNHIGKFGRLDVLIHFKKEPLCVLELKRPGILLTNADKQQGISYARLLPKMPPLVIVSNGSDVKFYRSFNMEEWVPQNIDEKAIEALFKHALYCAASDCDDAIRLLLGQDPQIWSEVIWKFSQKELQAITGEIEDFNWPLVHNFSLTRTSVNDLHSLIKENVGLIALVGAPLSGKTNVLCQFCDNSNSMNVVPLYIDSSNTNQGIIKRIANYFSLNLFFNTTPDDVRQWLRNCFKKQVTGKLVIIIDGWSLRAKDIIKEDIEELVELSNEAGFSIIIAVDDVTYEEIDKIPGKSRKCGIFRNAVKVNVGPLNGPEFNMARNYIKSKFSADFHDGVQYNTEFRNPRILRILLSRLDIAKQQINIRDPKEGELVYYYPSITTDRILENVWEKYVSNNQLRADLISIVKAYLIDAPNRKRDPRLLLFSYGKGYITYDVAEKELGTLKLERLIEQSLVQLVNGPSDSILVLPKVPEMLSSAAAQYIENEFFKILVKDGLDEAYNFLKEESEPFPYGDLVGANAVMRIGKRESSALSGIILKLLNDEPIIDHNSKNKKFLLHNPDTGIHEIELDSGEGVTLYGNLHPWLILSQIAINKISKVNDKHLHINILEIVGSFKGFLRRNDIVPLKDMNGFHFHEVKGIGEVLCGKAGIVEPITYAMVSGFDMIPEEMVTLSKRAEETNNYHLAFRLYIAANTSVNHADKNVIEAAKKVKDICNKVISSINKCDFYEKTFHKIGRNEPCPCGSGRKYKKCCGRTGL